MKKRDVFKASVAATVENSNDLRLTRENLNFFQQTDGGEYFTNENIFYSLVGTKNERTFDFTELGIGEIYKKNKNYYFKREYCFEFIENNETRRPRNGKILSLDKFKSHKLFLTESPPSHFILALASDYSVLCSTNKFVPCPVELQNKTLLGRLDGQIQSIDKSELRKILTDGEIINAVSQNKKTFDFNTRNINMVENKARMSTPYLHLKYNEDVRPQRGYLRFNYEDNCFEGYDGKRWRALMWESFSDEDTE